MAGKALDAKRQLKGAKVVLEEAHDCLRQAMFGTG